MPRAQAFRGLPPPAYLIKSRRSAQPGRDCAPNGGAQQHHDDHHCRSKQQEQPPPCCLFTRRAQWALLTDRSHINLHDIGG